MNRLFLLIGILFLAGIGLSLDFDDGGSGGHGTIGSSVTGGTANRVLFIDSSGNLADDSGFTYDGINLAVDGALSGLNVQGTTFFHVNGSPMAVLGGIAISTESDKTGGGISLPYGVEAATAAFSSTISVEGVTISSEVVKRQFTITLDGGGSVLAVGGKDLGLRAPYDMTVRNWQLASFPQDSTATVSVDVWGCAFGSFPASTDTLVGSSTPTVTAGNISSGTFSSPIALTEGMMLDVSVLAGVDVSTRAVLSLGGTIQ